MAKANSINNDLTGEKVKALRLAMALTQEQFSRQVGVTIITLSRWENCHMGIGPRHRKRIYEMAQAAHQAMTEPGRETAPDFSR